MRSPRTSGAIYVGGSFTQVGPRTGPGVGIDVTSGKSEGPCRRSPVGPRPLSTLWRAMGQAASTSAGDFTHVGGSTARGTLTTSLQADGSVDPNFSAETHIQLFLRRFMRPRRLRLHSLRGRLLHHIGGQTRHRIAALTGHRPGGHLEPERQRHRLRPGGERLLVYAGGVFTTIGGQSPRPRRRPRRHDRGGHRLEPERQRRRLRPGGQRLHRLTRAASSTASAGSPATGSRHSTGPPGQATSWNPDADGYVYALAVTGSTVYAGGNFSAIGGQARNHIAALDATTGAATSWNPNATATVRYCDHHRLGARRRRLDRLRRRGLRPDRRQGAQPSRRSMRPPAPRRAGTRRQRHGRRPRPGGHRLHRLRGRRLHLDRRARRATTSPRSMRRPGLDELEPERRRHRLRPSRSPARPSTRAGLHQIGGKPATGSPHSTPTGGATAWNPNANTPRLRPRRLRARPSTRAATSPRSAASAQLHRGTRCDHGRGHRWNPNADTAPGHLVCALAVSGSTVYAGGTSPPSAGSRATASRPSSHERGGHRLEPERRRPRLRPGGERHHRLRGRVLHPDRRCAPKEQSRL